MHLPDLRLENFRAFPKLELEGLSQLNLLIGQNNTGKTSVLEALQLYSQPFGRAWSDPFRFRGDPRTSFRRRMSHLDRAAWNFWNPGIPFSLDSDEDFSERSGTFSISSTPLPTMDAEFQYEVVEVPEEEVVGIYKEFGNLEEGSTPETVLARGLDIDVSLRGALIQRNLEGEEVMTDDSNFDLSFTDPPVRPGRGRVHPFRESPKLFDCEAISSRGQGRSDDAYWSTLTKRQEGEEVLELLQELDPSISKLQTDTSGTAPRLLVWQGDRWVPSEFMGQGFRRLLEFAGELVRARGGVLLIDEIEAGIHAWLLTEFAEWLMEALERYDVQVFATTHSLEAIDAFVELDSSWFNQVSAIRLEREPGGRIIPETLPGDLLHDLRTKYAQEVRA